MASLGVTSSLENKVARIPEIGQSGKNSVEISITIPKRNGTATQLTILDMDVHNSISVGSEFLNRIKAERRAIPDVVVNAKQVDRETLNEGRQVERCHIRFKGQLKSAPVEILCLTEKEPDKRLLLGSVGRRPLVYQWHDDNIGTSGAARVQHGQDNPLKLVSPLA
jgi:hypothetical protein